MPGPVSLNFSSAPSIPWSYARILLARKPSFATGTVQRIDLRLERFAIDSRHLARFRRVCGSAASPCVPITYPHVLAAPLHLAMFANPSFPVSPFGIVHLRNHIEQRRPLRMEDSGSIHAWSDSYRQTSRGQEFDLQTHLRIGSETVWSETSTFLARMRTGQPRGTAGPAGPGTPNLISPGRAALTTRTFAIHAATGRSYAFISADFNPIHLSNLTARLFGFRGCIAHGMWSLARCAAELDPALFAQPCTLDVTFRLPIEFRDTIVLESWLDAAGVGFVLRGRKERGHLHGSLAKCN
jgi:acyl dehydratase